MSSEPSHKVVLDARVRWGVVVLWLVAVGAIVYCADRRLLRPFFSFITSHPGMDKVGHFFLIGMTAFFLNVALGLRQWRFLGRFWLLGGTLAAIGFTLEEFSQLWFPSRTFDLLDLTSDYAGILCFGWLARRVFGPKPQV